MALTIGELAARAGVGVPTLRFYERRGILESPARSAAGYRLYEDQVVDRVRFVRRAQVLGFTLEEIQELLALRVEHISACHAVEVRTRAKLAQVEQKVRELQRMKRVLEQLVATCEARRPSRECPILETLEDVSNA